MEIASRQAEEIVRELGEKIENLIRFQTHFNQDSISCLMLMQGEQKHPSAFNVKAKMAQHFELAKAHIWNRCFNFNINEQKVIPFNLEQVNQIIAAGEISSETVIRVGRLLGNHYQDSALISHAMHTLQVDHFASKMRIDTHTWRERDPIKQALLNLMHLIAQKTECSFNLADTHEKMNNMLDGQALHIAEVGISLTIAYCHIDLCLSAASLQLLQRLQPAGIQIIPKQIGMHYQRPKVQLAERN